MAKERNQKPPGVAAFNIVYGNYRDRARIKGFEFCLTKDQFRAITGQPCHYCGKAPNHVFGAGKGKYNGAFVANGIDRKDSLVGYTTENCLPCCEICNKAKRDLSYDDFIVYLENLAAFRSARNAS